ncbi:MAG: hypothetical protein HY537_07890 [Deltaproteobacteria bacterium]|nr:hypothetical protein [Deltaproteobacteria bacterium]
MADRTSSQFTLYRRWIAGLCLVISLFCASGFRFYGLTRVGLDEGDSVYYYRAAATMYDKGQLYADGYIDLAKPTAIYSYLISFVFFGKRDVSLFLLNAILDTITLILLAWMGLRFFGYASALWIVLLYGFNGYSFDLVRTGLTHVMAFSYVMISLVLLLASYRAKAKRRPVLLFSSGVFMAVAFFAHGTVINVMIALLLCAFSYDYFGDRLSLRSLATKWVWLVCGGFAVVLPLEVMSLLYRDGQTFDLFSALWNHRRSGLGPGSDGHVASVPNYLRVMREVLPNPRLIFLLCALSGIQELGRIMVRLRKNERFIDEKFIIFVFSVLTILLYSSPYIGGSVAPRFNYLTILPIALVILTFVSRQRSQILRTVMLVFLFVSFIVPLAIKLPTVLAIHTQHAKLLGESLAKFPNSFVYRTGYWSSGVDLYRQISFFDQRKTIPNFLPISYLEPNSQEYSNKDGYMIFFHSPAFSYHSIEKYIFDNRMEYLRELSDERYYVFRDAHFSERMKPYQNGWTELKKWVSEHGGSDPILLVLGFPINDKGNIHYFFDIENIAHQLSSAEYVVFNNGFYREWYGNQIGLLTALLSDLSVFFDAYTQLRTQDGLPNNVIDYKDFSTSRIFDAKIRYVLDRLDKCADSGDSRCFAMAVALERILTSPAYPSKVERFTVKTLPIENLRPLFATQFFFNSVWHKGANVKIQKPYLAFLKCLSEKSECRGFKKTEDFNNYFVFRKNGQVNYR